MVTYLKAVAAKDFKLDGVSYKKGHIVDYSKWPKHTQFQLRTFLIFNKHHVKRAERIANAEIAIVSTEAVIAPTEDEPTPTHKADDDAIKE